MGFEEIDLDSTNSKRVESWIPDSTLFITKGVNKPVYVDNKWSDGSFLEEVLSFLKSKPIGGLRYALINSLSDLMTTYNLVEHHGKVGKLTDPVYGNDILAIYSFSEYSNAFNIIELASEAFSLLYSEHLNDKMKVVSAYIRFLSTGRMDFDEINSTYLNSDCTSYAGLLDFDGKYKYAPTTDILNQINPHMVLPYLTALIRDSKMEINDLEITMIVEKIVYHLFSNRLLLEYFLISIEFANPIQIKDYLNKYASEIDLNFLGCLSFLLFSNKSIEMFNSDVSAFGVTSQRLQNKIPYPLPVKMLLVALGKNHKDRILERLNDKVLPELIINRLNVSFQTNCVGTSPLPVVNDQPVQVGNINMITKTLEGAFNNQISCSNKGESYLLPLVSMELMRFKQAFYRSPIRINAWLDSEITAYHRADIGETFESLGSLDEMFKKSEELCNYLTSKEHTLSDLIDIVVATMVSKGITISEDALDNLNNLADQLYDMGLF